MAFWKDSEGNTEKLCKELLTGEVNKIEAQLHKLPSDIKQRTISSACDQLREQLKKDLSEPEKIKKKTRLTKLIELQNADLIAQINDFKNINHAINMLNNLIVSLPSEQLENFIKQLSSSLKYPHIFTQEILTKLEKRSTNNHANLQIKRAFSLAEKFVTDSKKQSIESEADEKSPLLGSKGKK